MTKRRFLLLATLLGMTLLAGAWPIAAQQPAETAGAPVHMIVTAEARHGTDVPVISREDAMVFEGRDRDKVTDFLPLQGDHASLELFILIDDASNTSLGSQLEDIRQFINS